jgi:hypothetical protein
MSNFCQKKIKINEQLKTGEKHCNNVKREFETFVAFSKNKQEKSPTYEKKQKNICTIVP